MKRGPQGRYLSVRLSEEPFKAFVPHALPPTPSLTLTPELYGLMERANRALGRLDGVSLLLPDISLFLYFYVRKEAVLSSQIEGTKSSLSDLLLFEDDEEPGVPLDDVQEVSSYVAALQYGLARVREGFPLSSRLLRETHGVLLSHGRGSAQNPGEFRRSQNWIGGTRPGNAAFVPPPQEEVATCIADLERFLHDQPEPTPTLIKAALAHVQFETIHPFLDGNGRLGRLMITLLLCAEGALTEPLLYLSYYFKKNRSRYYELLQGIRDNGDWEEWLVFFLEGVLVTSEQAARSAQTILRLFDEDRRKIETMGRTAGSALRVHYYLQQKPLTSIASAQKRLGMTTNTVIAALERLRELSIVRETTGRQRDRIYSYDAYLALLNEGTELNAPMNAEGGGLTATLGRRKATT